MILDSVLRWVTAIRVMVPLQGNSSILTDSLVCMIILNSSPFRDQDWTQDPSSTTYRSSVVIPLWVTWTGRGG